MTDPAVRALALLVEREGGRYAVAAQINCNPRTLYQIVAGIKLKSGKPRGVGRDLREKLERHYPGWLHEPPTTLDARGSYPGTVETITPPSTGGSHAMRLPAQRMPPPKIGWEALMNNELPREFETDLPDNAMAPDAPRGARVIFLAGVTPEPGDWVLLRDRTGEHHCREYRVVRQGHWEAHALNRGYLPLDSEQDGLQVLAVYDGQRGRRSAR